MTSTVPALHPAVAEFVAADRKMLIGGLERLPEGATTFSQEVHAFVESAGKEAALRRGRRQRRSRTETKSVRIALDLAGRRVLVEQREKIANL